MPSQGGGGAWGQVPPPPPSQEAVSALRTFFSGIIRYCEYIQQFVPPPSPKPNSEFWVQGGGAFIPSPKAVGLECVPPPHHPFRFLLPLQISCSPVVAKLICNSCAPYPPPTRLREIRKRALGCCRAGPMLLGWGE